MKKKIFFVLLSVQAFIYSPFIYAQAPDWAWAKGGGGVDGEYVGGIVTDANGNIYIVGYYWSPTITFGTTTLPNSGASDIFLVKYDVSGNLLWAKRAAGTGQDYATSITTDANGNIYVTGYFDSGQISFGASMLFNAN